MSGIGSTILAWRRRAADRSHAASRFAALVEHGSDLTSISDAEGRLVYASPAHRSVLGLDPDSCVGEQLFDRVHPDDRSAVFALGLELSSTPGSSGTREFRYAHEDGSWRWMETTMTNLLDDPAIAGYVTNGRDVTDRVLATERLAQQATHDVLTGLPNRVLMEERVVQARAAAIRHGEVLAAAFVDIDHFKDVNDTYGHPTGDLLLIEVADRLRAAARAEDTVARLGGDDFAVIAAVPDSQAAHELAAQICAAFTERCCLDGLTLQVTVSVGVADTATTGDIDLLQAADAAMYSAKTAGRARWCAFVSDSDQADAALLLTPETRPDPGAARRVPSLPVTQSDVSERYRRQVAEAKQAVVVHCDGVIVAVSPPALELFEADRAEHLVGHGVFEFVTADSMTTAQARQRAVEAGGWPQPDVIEIVRRSGGPLVVEVTSTPAFWDGQLASQMTIRLIADRWAEIVRLGAELTRSIDRAVIITDLRWKIVAWNEQAAGLYGWTSEEVVGRDLIDVVPWAGTDDELTVARRELATHLRWEGTATQVHRDGTTVAIDVVTQVIHDHDGDPIGIVSVNAPVAVPGAAHVDDTQLLMELAEAIRDDQLLVAYQPILTRRGHVAKVEALVRWRHPTRGLLLPTEFIPALERSSLVGALTAEVLRRATIQVAEWRREGAAELQLTVNVSGRELSDVGLVDRVTDALEASGLPPEALWLEITETALVLDAERARDRLAQLGRLGVRIALDDFGTGFATLAQLHKFPVHALKIDRMFVDGILADNGDAAIIRSVLALGRELGLEVIAEGVETAAQHEALLRMGCDLFQGFYLAHPEFPAAAAVSRPVSPVG